jgi:transcriptional regulator with XRE-family HTH domain
MSYNIFVKNKFAVRLNELLTENKISKRELAKKIGVSATSISDWSTGKIQPTVENVYLIAEYFQISADYLIGLKDI